MMQKLLFLVWLLCVTSVIHAQVIIRHLIGPGAELFQETRVNQSLECEEGLNWFDQNTKALLDIEYKHPHVVPDCICGLGHGPALLITLYIEGEAKSNHLRMLDALHLDQPIADGLRHSWSSGDEWAEHYDFICSKPDFDTKNFVVDVMIHEDFRITLKHIW